MEIIVEAIIIAACSIAYQGRSMFHYDHKPHTITAVSDSTVIIDLYNSKRRCQTIIDYNLVATTNDDIGVFVWTLHSSRKGLLKLSKGSDTGHFQERVFLNKNERIWIELRYNSIKRQQVNFQMIPCERDLK